MKRIIITCFTLILRALQVFADVSDHGRPWDADDNYDSSRGIWFVLFLIVIGIVVFIGAAAKHTWRDRSMLGQHGSHKTVPRSAF